MQIEETASIWKFYKNIGKISDPVPFSHLALGDTNFIATVTGKNFQIFNCDHLSLAFSSQTTEYPISRVHIINDHAVTLHHDQGLVQHWKRTKVTKTLQLNARIINSVQIGNHVVLILSDNRILTVDFFLKTKVEHQLPNSKDVTTIVHPFKYVNKVMIGYESGKTILFNFATGKIVYEFKAYNELMKHLSFSSQSSSEKLKNLALNITTSENVCSVTSLTASPFPHVVLVGLSTGHCILLDIYSDTILSVLSLDAIPTSASFILSKDYNVGLSKNVPLLAIGTDIGSLSLWNLDTMSIVNNDKCAHDRAIVSVQFLPQELLMVSLGADNSIKMWAFDTPNGHARFLNQRIGHFEPPHMVRMYNNDYNSLLSAGGDGDRSFRLFSLYSQRISFELSQGQNFHKLSRARSSEANSFKAPCIKQFSFNLMRARFWPNIVSCHEESKTVNVWEGQSNKLAYKYTMPDIVDCVCVSSCGNYAFISAGTHLHRLNLQSGTVSKKISIPENAIAMHTNAVATSLYVFCESGRIIIYNIKTMTESKVLNVGRSIIKSTAMDDICALALSDTSIVIVDLAHGNLARELSVIQGHACVDMRFTQDRKMLLIASVTDIYTVDVVRSAVIDVCHFNSAIRSFDVTENNQYIVVATSEDPGLKLYLNTTCFTGDSLVAVNEDHEWNNARSITEPFNMSLFSQKKWLTFENLDLIKSRNKISTAQLKKEDIPFFLDSTFGDNVVDDGFKILLEEEADTQQEAEVKRLADITPSQALRTPTQQTLTIWRKLTLSQLDAEIKLLRGDEILLFITLVGAALKSADRIDETISWLNKLVTCHSSEIGRNVEYTEALDKCINQISVIFADTLSSIQILGSMSDFLTK